MLHHDINAAAQRHAALRREAAELRRLHESRQAQPGRRRQFLDRLGQQLIAWGWRLRTRYGSLETVEQRQLEF
ncbi:MAG TPA: hypothetical protein PKA05_04390 [Roseiflexaceae bacterium]|nr:hypothetical protein [Roseiflexaceae bacterium]HMP39598.1 hypothetical protein [Roseiflexaceae bacterium]